MGNLQSRFAINEKVKIVMHAHEIPVVVTKIKFSESKVFYDLEYIGKESYGFEINNVISDFVLPI